MCRICSEGFKTSHSGERTMANERKDKARETRKAKAIEKVNDNPKANYLVAEHGKQFGGPQQIRKAKSLDVP